MTHAPSLSLVKDMFSDSKLSSIANLRGYVCKKILKYDGENDRITGLFTRSRMPSRIIKWLLDKHTSVVLGMKRESQIYSLLSAYTKLSDALVVPDYNQTWTTGNQFFSGRSYIEGKTLVKKSSKQIVAGFDSCRKTLGEIWARVPQSQRTTVATRHAYQQYLSFLFFLGKYIARNPLGLLDALRLGVVFFRNFTFSSLLSPSYTLAHRDMTAENILTIGRKVSLIDFEVGMVCEEETDLALFPRFYYRYIDSDQLLQYVNSQLKNSTSAKNFIRISIFYLIHFLSFENKASIYYKEASEYIPFFFNTLLPAISRLKNISVAEIVYHGVLRILSTSNFLFRADKPSILCYHAVDESGWRFSTPVRQFESQMSYLARQHRVVPLSDMVTSTGALTRSVAITFDDGYESIFTTAFPIMQRYHLTGTVFLLGNPDTPNRESLDNTLPLLTKKQIQILKKNGWEFGYHTYSHTALHTLNDTELLHEVVDTRNAAEKTYGIELPFFAYPQGRYTARVLEYVQRANYKAAFTINAGSVNTHNIRLINRVPMEGTTPINEFNTLVRSHGLLFSKLFMTILRTKADSMEKMKTFLAHLS